MFPCQVLTSSENPACFLSSSLVNDYTLWSVIKHALVHFRQYRCLRRSGTRGKQGKQTLLQCSLEVHVPKHSDTHTKDSQYLVHGLSCDVAMAKRIWDITVWLCSKGEVGRSERRGLFSDCGTARPSTNCHPCHRDKDTPTLVTPTGPPSSRKAVGCSSKGDFLTVLFSHYHTVART